MTRALICGILIYGALTLLGWAKTWAERPHTCPRGHTDHYCCNRWRCRECARLAEARGLRKLARERSKSNGS